MTHVKNLMLEDIYVRQMEDIIVEIKSKHKLITLKEIHYLKQFFVEIDLKNQ